MRLLLLLIILSSTSLFSREYGFFEQKSILFLGNSNENFQAGLEFYNQKKYNKAIKHFKKSGSNESMFYLAKVYFHNDAINNCMKTISKINQYALSPAQNDDLIIIKELINSYKYDKKSSTDKLINVQKDLTTSRQDMKSIKQDMKSITESDRNKTIIIRIVSVLCIVVLIIVLYSLSRLLFGWRSLRKKKMDIEVEFSRIVTQLPGAMIGQELTPYQILGVSESDNMETIKKTYRKLIITCHPDKVHKLHPGIKSMAGKMTKNINMSYKQISEIHEKNQLK